MHSSEFHLVDVITHFAASLHGQFALVAGVMNVVLAASTTDGPTAELALRVFILVKLLFEMD